MRQINFIKFLRAAIVIFIISVSVFTLNSCTGCNSTSKDDTLKDSTTTTNVTDSLKMGDSTTNRMMDSTRKDSSGKGDQLPPPK